MSSCQRFIITARKLKNISEVKSILRILGKFINLNCDIENVDADFRREHQWGFYPAIKIKRRNGYFIEIAHIGYYPKGLRGKLAALKKKLKERFKGVSIKHLNIDELKAI